MLHILLEHRGLVSAIVAAGVWSFGHLRVPFPATNDMLVLVAANAPHVHAAIRFTCSVLWFTSPFLASSFALSFVYIFLLRPRAGIERIALPRYPEPAHRSALLLVLGEVHKERRPTAVDRPRWLTIPRRALFTGIGIFAAVGSGKTTCCMYPFAEQLLAFHRDDPERRIGSLVLEVKGDFCYRVREILRKHGREDDYIELSLDCPYRYNPLYNHLEAYALAYGIASLLTNLFGRGRDPFWQQAYTNVVKFATQLHKCVYGYVTLFDVYECAINPDLLAQLLVEGGLKGFSEAIEAVYPLATVQNSGRIRSQSRRHIRPIGGYASSHSASKAATIADRALRDQCCAHAGPQGRTPKGSRGSAFSRGCACAQASKEASFGAGD